MSSIHQKITVSFSFLAIIIVFISVFAYTDLYVLKNKLDEGDIVTQFKDDILEIRRHEKNFFLYHHSSEMDLTIQYIEKVLSLVNSKSQIFTDLNNRDEFENFVALIIQYQQLLTRYSEQENHHNRDQLAKTIRDNGHQISLFTEQLAIKERHKLTLSIQHTQWALAGAILLVAGLTILIGIKMAKAVVTPLKNLEKGLSSIAEGHFDHLESSNQDQEIVTFTQAFNRMLYELEVKQKRVLQAEKLASLGVLVSGVAHELNNPLGNVLSSCQLVIEEFDSGEKALLKDWLQQIDTETERACRIVKTLQDFGRNKEFFIETVDFNDLLSQTFILLKRNIHESCQIITDVPDQLELSVDPQRFQQVLINIIKNALDSAERDITIKISATDCLPGNPNLPENAYVLGKIDQKSNLQDYLKITIADNGPGISQSILKNIFDPFFTTRNPGKGMGIGLYIVQEIIQEHNGIIAVTSQIDQGTQFNLFLPCLNKTSVNP